MKKFIVSLMILAASAVAQAASFADLAVMMAKGWFGRYVPQDAPLERCVAFLSSRGICFSLFDLMDPQVKVTQEDFARTVGQATLLFSGEAELENGCIKKPLEADTWVDYCVLNDVDLLPLWEGFVRQSSEGSRPEVQEFFGGALQAR
jgi:hypothetical protein